MIIPAQCFQTNNTVELARSLIGKYLVRQYPQQSKHYLITEVEAYDGPEDKACQGRFGLTSRTQVMFEPGGCWYVYLCYGIHWLLNLVTGDANFPAAILIRGVNQIKGPGRVTKALHIDKHFYGLAATPDSGLWLEDLGYQPGKIISTPRIGIDYAGDYRHKPWRFVLADELMMKVSEWQK